MWLYGQTSGIACSVKASAAVSTLRTRLAELSKKADLIQLLLGSSAPVNMQSLASEEQVVSLHFYATYIYENSFTVLPCAMYVASGKSQTLTVIFCASVIQVAG